MFEKLYYQIYFAGYRGLLPPRWLRRLLAKTEIHRIRLAGCMGAFMNDGVRMFIYIESNEGASKTP